MNLNHRSETYLFSGLYLQVEKNPSPLREIDYLTLGDFSIEIVFGKYQLIYDGTLILEIYQRKQITVIEFICILNKQSVFKAIKETLKVVLPSYQILSRGENKWLLKKKI